MHVGAYKRLVRCPVRIQADGTLDVLDEQARSVRGRVDRPDGIRGAGVGHRQCLARSRVEPGAADRDPTTRRDQHPCGGILGPEVADRTSEGSVELDRDVPDPGAGMVQSPHNHSGLAQEHAGDVVLADELDVVDISDLAVEPDPVGPHGGACLHLDADVADVGGLLDPGPEPVHVRDGNVEANTVPERAGKAVDQRVVVAAAVGTDVQRRAARRGGNRQRRRGRDRLDEIHLSRRDPSRQTEAIGVREDDRAVEVERRRKPVGGARRDQVARVRARERPRPRPDHAHRAVRVGGSIGSVGFDPDVVPAAARAHTDRFRDGPLERVPVPERQPQLGRFDHGPLQRPPLVRRSLDHPVHRRRHAGGRVDDQGEVVRGVGCPERGHVDGRPRHRHDLFQLGVRRVGADEQVGSRGDGPGRCPVEHDRGVTDRFTARDLILDDRRSAGTGGARRAGRAGRPLQVDGRPPRSARLRPVQVEVEGVEVVVVVDAQSRIGSTGAGEGQHPVVARVSRRPGSASGPGGSRGAGRAAGGSVDARVPLGSLRPGRDNRRSRRPRTRRLRAVKVAVRRVEIPVPVRPHRVVRRRAYARERDQPVFAVGAGGPRHPRFGQRSSGRDPGLDVLDRGGRDRSRLGRLVLPHVMVGRVRQEMSSSRGSALINGRKASTR